MGRSQPAKGSNLGGKVDGWDIAVRAERPNIPVIYASANPVKEERKVPGSASFDKPLTLSHHFGVDEMSHEITSRNTAALGPLKISSGRIRIFISYRRARVLHDLGQL